MKKQFYSSAQSLVPRLCKKAGTVLSVLFVLLLTAGKSFSQEKLALGGIPKDTSAAAWHVLKTVGSVTVSYHYTNCGPTEFIQFKISNTSASKVAVSWVYKYVNNGTALDLIPDLAKVNYTLEGNSSVEGGCSSEHFKLGVFVREEGVMMRMTDIELNELTVTAQ